MANRFIEQAQSQVAPIYDQQIQQQQAQIPSIQKLYQSLISGLEQQNQQQLNTGVQQISEDASARGVLRSSLPVDARTTLTAQLGAALNQGKSQLGLQQLGDISQVNARIGELQQGRLSAIQQLADTLYNQDLKERAFQMEQQAAAAAARSGSRGGGGGGGVSLAQARQEMAAALAPHRGKKDKYVSPAIWNRALDQWVSQGLSASSFRSTFSAYRPSAKSRQKNYR